MGSDSMKSGGDKNILRKRSNYSNYGSRDGDFDEGLKFTEAIKSKLKKEFKMNLQDPDISDSDKLSVHKEVPNEKQNPSIGNENKKEKANLKPTDELYNVANRIESKIK